MIDLEEKCDVILDMHAPDFAERLREALGVQPGEVVQISTPQFDRTDGITPSIPLMDFAKLPGLSEVTLKQIGCQQWDEPDGDGHVLWLFPAEWYDHIPDGTLVVTINGETEAFKHGKTDDDRRFGALAYGFRRKNAL